MQDQKEWQTVISEDPIVQEHALVRLWIPIFLKKVKSLFNIFLRFSCRIV